MIQFFTSQIIVPLTEKRSCASGCWWGFSSQSSEILSDFIEKTGNKGLINSEGVWSNVLTGIVSTNGHCLEYEYYAICFNIRPAQRVFLYLEC